MVINTNVSAQNGARLLGESSAMLAKSLARLSSGSKIVNPEDDVAGLAISMRFDAQINRLSAAQTNIGNAISMSQTQDGFLAKAAKALDRMSELSVLAQDVTKGTADRALYQTEFGQLQSYVTDLASKTFNSVTLFGASPTTSAAIPMDSEGGTYNMLGVTFGLSAGAFIGSYLNAFSAATSITSTTLASQALGYVKSAIADLASDRATVGANRQRLSFTAEQLATLKENLTTSNSRIKDVDVAEESTQYARYNILVQAGTAMLAQANATPQSALRLLNG